MTNLLPPVAQKKVWRWYRARIVTVFSLALIVLAMLFMLALIPSYLALSAVAPRDVSGTQSPRKIDDAQAMTRAQTIVKHVLPVLVSTSSPSVFIEAALSEQPPGVTLSHIAYSPNAASGPTLVIAGTATRDKVAAYRDALSKNPLFTSATVPVSALLGTSAAEFTITLNLLKGRSQ